MMPGCCCWVEEACVWPCAVFICPALGTPDSGLRSAYCMRWEGGPVIPGGWSALRPKKDGQSVNAPPVLEDAAPLDRSALPSRISRSPCRTTCSLLLGSTVLKRLPRMVSPSPWTTWAAPLGKDIRLGHAWGETGNILDLVVSRRAGRGILVSGGVHDYCFWR